MKLNLKNLKSHNISKSNLFLLSHSIKPRLSFSDIWLDHSESHKNTYKGRRCLEQSSRIVVQEWLSIFPRLVCLTRRTVSPRRRGRFYGDKWSEHGLASRIACFRLGPRTPRCPVCLCWRLASAK